MTLRFDLCSASGSPLRVFAAALAACWPSYATKNKGATFAASGHNVLEYGGRAADWMQEAGVSPADIMRAGNVARDMILESLPGPAEVEEVAKNSEAQEDPEP
jgi:hypothetical protein